MNSMDKRQQMIYDYLREKKTTQSAYDILDACRDHGVRAPSQIYRELNKLIERGLIHKVESLNAYIACEQEHEIGQSIICICNNCGLVKEMPASNFVDHTELLRNQDEFTPQQMNVEVKGRCADCS